MKVGIAWEELNPEKVRRTEFRKVVYWTMYGYHTKSARVTNPH
jgi:hypothetical protein